MSAQEVAKVVSLVKIAENLPGLSSPRRATTKDQQQVIQAHETLIWQNRKEFHDKHVPQKLKVIAGPRYRYSLFDFEFKDWKLKNRRHFMLSYITKKSLFKYIELKILSPKNENFQIKIRIFFYTCISAQNIDCGYSLEPYQRSGSNEYPQSMLLSRNKNNNIYPCKPQFYYIKMGFKEVNII